MKYEEGKTYTLTGRGPARNRTRRPTNSGK